MDGSAPASFRDLSTRAREIVSVARRLLEEHGAEALSTRNIAQRIGIRAPALYRHFADKHEIELILIEEGLRESGYRTLAAIDGADDPLAAMVFAHRSWALEHPHLYRLSFGESLDRSRLDPAAEQHAGMAIFIVTGGDADVSRAIWAFVHGMIDLELLDRFPPGSDVDAVWWTGVEALRTRLTPSPPSPASA